MAKMNWAKRAKSEQMSAHGTESIHKRESPGFSLYRKANRAKFARASKQRLRKLCKKHGTLI
jgi:hypothetical protein